MKKSIKKLKKSRHSDSKGKVVVSSSSVVSRSKKWLFLLIIVPAIAAAGFLLYKKYNAPKISASAKQLYVLPIFDDKAGSSIVACRNSYPNNVTKTVFIFKKPIGQKDTTTLLQGVEKMTGNQWWGDEVHAMEVEVPRSGYLSVAMMKGNVRYVNESVPLQGIPDCYWD